MIRGCCYNCCSCWKSAADDKLFSVTVMNGERVVRRVWRYQRGNQNPCIEEEQTTQWPKEKRKKDKQRSTKQPRQTKYISGPLWHRHSLPINQLMEHSYLSLGRLVSVACYVKVSIYQGNHCIIYYTIKETFVLYSYHQFDIYKRSWCSIFGFLCGVLYTIVCPFVLVHCIVCPSSIYDFWLLFWYL
jgi:hypothetical protein